MATATVNETTPLDTATLEAEIQSLAYYGNAPREDRAAAREQYRADVAALKARWKTYLFSYNTDLSTAALEVIYEQAWEDGHSSGYYNVEAVFETLLDMVRKVRQADVIARNLAAVTR